MDNADRYSTSGFPGLALDLARIREPHDILGFAKQYGLLRHGPNHEGECKEPIEAWLEEALAMALIIDLAVTTHDAAAGDLEALARIRRRDDPFDVLIPQTDVPPQGILEEATLMVSAWINRFIGPTQEILVPGHLFADGQPATYRLIAQPETLLGYAYYDLATDLVGEVPFERCPSCGRYFIVEHGRQKFCTPRCAGRARYKRFSEKRKETSRAS